MAVKLFGKASGLLIHIGSTVLFGMLAFGMWSFSSEDECYAVEYPDNKQYDHDPITSDPNNYIGLKVHNISNRFSNVLYTGFVLNILLSIICVLTVMRGSQQMNAINTLLGYLTLGWFMWLLFARYDHFCRVCSGDYLEATAKNAFPLL